MRGHGFAEKRLDFCDKVEAAQRASRAFMPPNRLAGVFADSGVQEFGPLGIEFEERPGSGADRKAREYALWRCSMGILRVFRTVWHGRDSIRCIAPRSAHSTVFSVLKL